MKHITNIFLQIEHNAREFFEQFPYIQAFFAGVGFVLFWRGVWEIMDQMNLDPILSIVIGSLLLGAIGLFLHTFVGNAIIIKHVEIDKSMDRVTKREMFKVEAEVHEEEVTLSELSLALKRLEEKIDAMHNK
jgi:hypothetical protein